MGLSSVAVLSQGLPVLVDTFFSHYLNRSKSVRDSAARSELLYDEAFSVMKAFLEFATKSTVEDLQRFSNSHMPAPPSVLVVRVLVPLASCTRAAELLVAAFGGADEARRVVGGTEWWRVRGKPGVECEWIVGKKMWAQREKEQARRRKLAERDRAKHPAHHHRQHGAEGGAPADAQDGQGQEDEPDLDRQMEDEGMDEMRCMLYIHGGAHYWGSINTHRYTIWRYARKMSGRALAVNYRKSPQYPFPCALQDCLAAYLYLLDPPPGSKHRPVPPSQIVIAGDSAGGGLTLALLQVLRDVGLPLPAGAVPISPWVDLTHSFPSVMENFATDVMPPYGFVHKPSTLWPPPAPELSESVQRSLKARVREAVDRLKERSPGDDEGGGTSAGSTDGGEDDEDGGSGDETDGEALARTTSKGDTTVPLSRTEQDRPAAPPPPFSKAGGGGEAHAKAAGKQPTADYPSAPSTTAKGDSIDPPSPASSAGATPHGASVVHDAFAGTAGLSSKEASRRLHPHTEGGGGPGEKPPATGDEGKSHQHAVDPTDGGDIRIVIDGKEQVIRGQIQHYTTNRLLPHPYVSPAFGYLGGLCPLLIIASDKELLRDEILYTAHKAARPDQYPIPEHVVRMMPALAGMADKYGPTEVHLQVYDEVCHVLPLYSMTTPAKYCFRAIANFCKFVTPRGGRARAPSPNPLSPLASRGASPVPSERASPAPAPAPADGEGVPPPWLGPEVVLGEPLEDRPLVPSPRTSLDVPRAPSPAVASLAAEGGCTSNPHARSHTASTDPPRSTTAGLSNGSSANGAKRRWLTIDALSSRARSAGPSPTSSSSGRQQSEDVAGPRFEDATEPPPPEGPETAGHPSVYEVLDGMPNSPFADDHMIRERISTRGLRRPLEPEADLPALHVPFDELAKIKELPAKRYLTGQTLWDKKFARTARRVERHRLKNLQRSHKLATKALSAWQSRVASSSTGVHLEGDACLLNAPGETWAWALKGENPPPSAVVSRRDTDEAVELARIADETGSDAKLGGLNLWTSVVDLLTRSGGRTPKSSDPPTHAAPTPSPSSTSHKPSPRSAPGSSAASGEASDAEGAGAGNGERKGGSRLAMPTFLRKLSARAEEDRAGVPAAAEKEKNAS